MDWIWIIVALLAGLAAGGAAAYVVMKRRYGDRDSVAEVRAEYHRYRSKVTEHFVETADLVNTLTRSYKRVYDHLESGAYDLVGEETLRKQLDAPEEAPVTIEYLGQRRSEGPVPADRPAARPARPVPRTTRAPTQAADPSNPSSALRRDAAAPASRDGGEPRPNVQASSDLRPGPQASTEPTERPSEERGAETERSEAEERTRSAG